MLDTVRSAYCFILLEQTLSDVSIINRIEALPDPFKTYLEKIRTAMSKAKFAKTDKDLIEVNSEVNVWRDRIIEAWRTGWQKLAKTVADEINELFSLIVSRYTELMGRIQYGILKSF